MAEALAHYRCETKTFIAPERMEEGQTFYMPPDWIPGPHLTPLNDAAEAAMELYYKNHPGATLHPIEALPNAGVAPVLGERGAVKPEDSFLTLAEAGTSKAQPGLDQGGKASKAS